MSKSVNSSRASNDDPTLIERLDEVSATFAVRTAKKFAAATDKSRQERKSRRIWIRTGVPTCVRHNEACDVD